MPGHAPDFGPLERLRPVMMAAEHPFPKKSSHSHAKDFTVATAYFTCLAFATAAGVALIAMF